MFNMLIQKYLRWLFLGFVIALPNFACAQETKTSDSTAADKTFTNSIGMKLILIPAGKFTMGSPMTEAEREPQETPHEVEIVRPFFMGVYEVTQRQFDAVLGIDRKRRAFFDRSNGGGPDHPIENISRSAVIDFCTELSALPAERRAGRKYRLPTEAEWEYACRAGKATEYHHGDSLSSNQANFNGNYPHGGAEKGPYLRKTAKVGSYQPNAFGLYDMHGNVAEWCGDWYDKDYYQRSPKKDPRGPSEGASIDDFGNSYLVVRGGSWIDDARACRSAYRFRAMTRNRYHLFGFRVVCETVAAQ